MYIIKLIIFEFHHDELVAFLWDVSLIRTRSVEVHSSHPTGVGVVDRDE